MTEKEILEEIHQFLNERKEKIIIERIEAFRKERIELIEKDEGPLKLHNEGMNVLLHLISKYSLTSKKEYDLSVFHRREDVLPTLRDSTYSQTYNFEGLLHYNHLTDQKTRGYVQLFRNGIIEALSEYSTKSTDEGWRNLKINIIESRLIEITKEYIEFLHGELNIDFPIFFLLTLIGVENSSILLSGDASDDIHPFGRQRLDLPAKIIENPNIDFSEFFSDIFDRIWNAAGYPKRMGPPRKG